MPYYRVPLGSLLPDSGELDGGSLVSCWGLVPYGSGYVPEGGREVVTGTGQPANTPITGFHVHDESGRIMWATDRVWETRWNAGSGVWTTQSRTGAIPAAGVDEGPIGPEGMQFASYGPTIIAVSGHQTKGRYWEVQEDGTLTSTAAFNVKAKFVAAWGNRVAVANLHDDDSKVWVSVTDNPVEFGDSNSHPAGRTASFPLYDGFGPITALAGGADFGYVFKGRALYRAHFRGQVGVEFQLLDQTVGTLWPNSLCWVNGDLYFWAATGPAVVRQEGRVQELGYESVSRQVLDAPVEPLLEFAAPSGGSRVQLWAAYSPDSRTVVWYYPTTTSPDRPIVGLALDVDAGRFSLLDRPEGVLAATTMREPEARWSPLQGQLVASGTEFWRASRLGQPWGDGSIRVKTGWFAIGDPGRKQVQGVRPGYTLRSPGLDGEARPLPTIKPTATAALGSRMVPWGDAHESTGEHMDDRGFLRTSEAQQGVEHQVSLTLTDVDDVSSLHGFALEFRDGGTR